MTEEEKIREMCRSNYAAQMAVLGYGPDGMALPKKNKSEWVSVKDRLPPYLPYNPFPPYDHSKTSDRVLVYGRSKGPKGKDGFVTMGRFEEGSWILVGGKWYCEVTHWMPFPNPPEEEA